MHICENTPGGYNCKCNQDFKVDDADSKKCIPENPCQQNQHGCEHVCYQSDGQDKCSCRAGYTLNQDGKTCSDLDECATNQHRCTQGCKNTVGSYLCSCVNGFTLDSNGFSCNDIDECLAWTFNCTDVSQKCKNSYGSYKCVCDEGLYWIDKSAKDLIKVKLPHHLLPPCHREHHQMRKKPIRQLGDPRAEYLPVERTIAREVQDYFSRGSYQTLFSGKGMSIKGNQLQTQESRKLHHIHGGSSSSSAWLSKADLQRPTSGKPSILSAVPPGSSSPVIKKDVLVAIVQGSMAEISRSINANISSVQTLFADTTPSVTPTVPTTISTEKDESKNMNYIIGGCVAGGVVLVLVVIAAVWCCKRKNGIGKQRVDSEQSITNRGQKMEMDVVNYGYGQSITPHH
ncbi:Fibrillin-2 [Desmophyllum pertusum]|uniref:Fibrillin-2 n=1 Tax=Desmophyllum pertusum TaxID=174260 RepID=A0A9X0CSV8_9CNID|nr:Fibrillin-2 [Desmophyllum pertusum]